MPNEVLQPMFLAALSWGFQEPQLATWLIPLAILIRVGYLTLLRPGEICRLLVKDMHFCADGRQVVIAIRRVKTPTAFGRAQFVVLHCRLTRRLLAWLVAALPNEMKIWPGSVAKFSQFFVAVLHRLGLSRLPLTPGGLRAGGTTVAYKAGSPIA